MKKVWIFVLTLVLTAALFAGCGCTNTGRGNATTPTGMPTSMPTVPTTEATTVPTTQATRPTIEETTPSGNGVLEDDNIGTTASTEETIGARSRSNTSGSGNGITNPTR